MKNRLHTLDGLRGLAIILVLLTHIPLGVWYDALPEKFHFLLKIILGNGPIGVFVFFLLTGFLMGMLYPQPLSLTSFLSRRYLRLFPPFLAMVAGFTVIALMGKNPAFLDICIMLVSIIIIRKIWIFLENHYRVNQVPIVWWALTTQIVVACGYIMIVLKVPASVYLQIWNPAVRTVIAGIVNATLTLPFGNYIGQIDGVYWTLVAEVFFYLLYPTIVQPLTQHINATASRRIKTLLALLLFPFFYGLDLIAQRILGMQIIQVHYMVYFVAGVVIAQNRTYLVNAMGRYKSFFKSRLWLGVLLSLILIFLGLPTVPKIFYEPYQFLWIVPLSFLLVTLLIEESAAAQFFRNPLLVFFGIYSYSIYLTHSFIIKISQEFIPVKTPVEGLWLMIISIIATIIFSLILYELIEKRYFVHRKAEKVQKDRMLSQKIPIYKSYLSTQKRCLVFFITMLIVLYIAYKPPLSFFTQSQRVGVTSLFSKNNIILLSDHITEKSFIANSNNLGMIQFHIRNKLHSIDGYVESSLIVRLFNEQHVLISTSSYELSQIIDSRYHPFGFPIQVDSKNRRYFVEYQLTKNLSTQTTELITTEGDFIAVYFPTKKELFTDLITWVVLKITEPFTNPLFWLNVVFVLPFIGLLQLHFIFKARTAYKLPLAKI